MYTYLFNRVLESVKAGTRLPETPFADLRVAAKGQQSVYGIFKQNSKTGPSQSAQAEPHVSATARRS